MLTSVQVRPLQPSETEEIAAIAVRAWEPIYAYYYDAMGEPLFTAEHPDWRQEKALQVRCAAQGQGGARILVAVAEAQVVGFVSFYLDEAKAIGEIGNNAVDPAFQSHGIGAALHSAALEAMREAGMRYARVDTGLDEAHAPARRAYERRGFHIALPSVTYYREL